jgi:hypothetical protein
LIEINFAREILNVVQAFLLLGMRTQPMYRIILSRLWWLCGTCGNYEFALIMNFLLPLEIRMLLSQ